MGGNAVRTRLPDGHCFAEAQIDRFYPLNQRISMDRYRIFRRGRTWYLENAATGKQTSLHTRDRTVNSTGSATSPAADLENPCAAPATISP